MSGEERITRGSVFYWVGFAILWIAITSLAWYFFRPPGQLGI
jgi:hypothetical protein